VTRPGNIRLPQSSWPRILKFYLFFEQVLRFQLSKPVIFPPKHRTFFSSAVLLSCRQLSFRSFETSTSATFLCFGSFFNSSVHCETQIQPVGDPKLLRSFYDVWKFGPEPKRPHGVPIWFDRSTNKDPHPPPLPSRTSLILNSDHPFSPFPTLSGIFYAACDRFFENPEPPPSFPTASFTNRLPPASELKFTNSASNPSSDTSLFPAAF